MNRAADEAEIEAAYPQEDDDVHFAMAMFDTIGHLGLSALTDQAIAFLARTIRQSKQKALEPLPDLPSAIVLPFPGVPHADAP